MVSIFDLSGAKSLMTTVAQELSFWQVHIQDLVRQKNDQGNRVHPKFYSPVRCWYYICCILMQQACNPQSAWSTGWRSLYSDIDNCDPLLIVTWACMCSVDRPEVAMPAHCEEAWDSIACAKWASRSESGEHPSVGTPFSLQLLMVTRHYAYTQSLQCLFV